MTHEWHDAFRHRWTPAHHLDPRGKLFVGLLFVGLMLSTPRLDGPALAGYVALLAAAAAGARLPPGPLLRRALLILPFALLMAASAFFSPMSRRHLADSVYRGLLSVGAMAVVSMTTPFPEMLRALEQARLPKVFVLFLAFLYRYGAVLRREGVQLERGWSARYFGRRRAAQWGRLGEVLTALLIRSYERAERVYAAMLARGFSSRSSLSHVLHWTVWDAAFVAASVSLMAAVRWGAAG